MSLPSELRVLCFQLSNTPVADLPRFTPTLRRQVLQCQVPLSSPSGNTAKPDASESSVLVHKLKTQLTTLLNGKSPEGRFAAVVLIKSVVEVGGWEVLQSSGPWVRGLLSVLEKPDSAATKELCIVALTKIYCMTHEYQTLVREITTPTLPSFVTACLNVISSKSSGKPSDIPSSLTEIIFRSFANLVPRHTTIFRPFVSHIRAVAKPYLAPTLSDPFVSLSLKESARHLAVVLHLTGAKNTGGEAWGKAVRELVTDVHATADQVFRAVVEDWESAAGYMAEPVDVNQELSGSGKTSDDLLQWVGITAGVERLVGLLGMLEEYFKHETSMPVAIPLGVIVDMTTRLLSISVPSSAQSGSRYGGTRLHPAIDRVEKDGLWSGMPGIYVAALNLIAAIASRLGNNLISLAQTLLDQVAWVFPSGKHDPLHRQATYQLLLLLLPLVGSSLDRKQCVKLSMIMRSCCEELQLRPATANAGASTETLNVNGKRPHNQNLNADSFLSKPGVIHNTNLRETDLVIAAHKLLPFFMSHVPQQYLDISLRSLIERTAILSHNKDAMLASVLNPFVGKNGKSIASILPHLAREFGDDPAVEMLLRPRLPMVPSAGTRITEEENGFDEFEDEDREMHQDTIEEYSEPHTDVQSMEGITSQHGLGNRTVTSTSTNHGLGSSFPTTTPTPFALSSAPSPVTALMAGDPLTVSHDGLQLHTPASPPRQRLAAPTLENDEDEDSDGSSVHLTMGLDTDSDTDG